LSYSFEASFELHPVDSSVYNTTINIVVLILYLLTSKTFIVEYLIWFKYDTQKYYGSGFKKGFKWGFGTTSIGEARRLYGGVKDP